MKRQVVVNDGMQQGYIYYRTDALRTIRISGWDVAYVAQIRSIERRLVS